MRRCWQAMRGDDLGHPAPLGVVTFVFGYIALLIAICAVLVHVVAGVARMVR